MDDAPAIQIPEDPAALRAMCATLSSHVAERDATIARLTSQILWLRKQLYGPRADRLSSDAQIGQMLLEFAAQVDAMPVQAEDAAAGEKAAEEQTPRRRIGATKGRHGRRRIADLEHLPVTTLEHDLPEAEKSCACCGGAKHRIGTQESWQVEYVPGHFHRLHHVRHVYACSACEAAGNGGQVVAAEKSEAAVKGSPVEKGMLGPGLMAFVATSKFADYLPLYRLENIFGRAGLEIARSTLCQCGHDVAEIARPVYDLMCDRVRDSRVVATDDTVMPLLPPPGGGGGKTRKARMWS